MNPPRELHDSSLPDDAQREAVSVGQAAAAVGEELKVGILLVKVVPPDVIKIVESTVVGVAMSVGGLTGVVTPPQLVVTTGISPQLKQMSSVQLPVGVLPPPLVIGVEVVV